MESVTGMNVPNHQQFVKTFKTFPSEIIFITIRIHFTEALSLMENSNDDDDATRPRMYKNKCKSLPLQIKFSSKIKICLPCK